MNIKFNKSGNVRVTFVKPISPLSKLIGFARPAIISRPSNIPEYWWRADLGLSTSGWTAVNGGINFTLYNVSSANSTTGILFNGTNGYGLTTNFPSNVDVKHVFIRVDSFVKPAGGSLVALTGNTTNNIHQFPAYFNLGGFFWYYIENIAGSLTYANRGTVDLATTAIWADFTNGGTSIVQYANADTTGYDHPSYLGTFNNRIRMPSGNGVYIGRRHEGNYANFYLKELALFTTSLTVSQGLEFRDSMNARWP
jgi:hypothetical protein